MHQKCHCLKSLNLFWMALILFFHFAPAPSFAADELTPPEDIVSICNRTEQVRIEIQKEIGAMRFTAGSGGVVRCSAVRADELKNITSLQIIEKDLSALKPGDFDGLAALTTLDLEGNHLETLDPSALAGLTSLENLFVARNPIRTLKDELHVLPHLKRVDFSGGQLSIIAPGAFDGNPELQSVFLSDNQLTMLPEGIFLNNEFLQTLDLSGNWLVELPRAFVYESGALQNLDLSRNRLTGLDGAPFSKLSALRVINISDNPLDASAADHQLHTAFKPDIRIVTATEEQPNVHPAQVIYPDPPAAPVADGIEKLRSFVCSHWHVPIQITVSHSSPALEALTCPGLRAREERLLLRQLEEVREAYRRAAFDFFEVHIRFEAPDSTRSAPAVTFNKKKLGIDILLKAPAEASQGAALISDDRILDVLADHFSRNRSIVWFRNEVPEELEAALRRDFEKISRMDDELRFDVNRLDDLIDTAMERMQRTGGRKFFSETELTGARLIQFRMMLTFQRLENTLARWRLAQADPSFPYRAEARLILAQASGMYRTYLDWFLNTVLGDRPLINVLSEEWYRLNPIFRILDSEVPAGFFNLDGRVSTRIPDGAVRDLLRSRLNAPLLHFLYGMTSLDHKVTAADIDRSPLREQMTQAKERIVRNRRSLAVHKISDLRAFKELWEVKLKLGVKFPFYRVTTSLACLIGDTRLSHPLPAITDEQLEEMKTILKPGDLLVSRTDYYLSNAFLGGFWPHGILYLGPKEQWSRLKLADGTILAEDPWIFKNILPNYRSQMDNRPAMVMEAISEGVVFNSLEEAVQKDYIAIFRPSFADEEQEAKVAAAIRRALRYHGRAYDFDFDFFTDDKLVCTELLYRAYHPDINFLVQKKALQKPAPPVPGMVKKAGRDTMPATEIVKLALYMKENTAPNPSIGYPGKTLEFVRLYMKQEKGRPARILEGAKGIEALKLSLR